MRIENLNERRDESERWTALAVQMVDMDDGVILRRGCSRMKIYGTEARAVLDQLLAFLRQPGGATVAEAAAAFSVDDRDSITRLLGELSTRRILVKTDELPVDEPESEDSALGVYCWDVGKSRAQLRQSLAQKDIVVVGVNNISRQIVRSLMAADVEHLQVVDHPFLRNLSFYDDEARLDPAQWHADMRPPVLYDDWAEEAPEGGCLVVTSDFGGLQLMREWNAHCVRFGQDFFPVVLQDHIGYVGPVVVPGETPCFECLWARQNSHLEDTELNRATEPSAFFGQIVSGYLPTMAAIVGDLAANELLRFYGGVLPPQRPGTLIEVDLLKPALQTRAVLKVPRCPVCSPFVKHGTRSVDKSVFLSGNPVES